MTAFQGVEQSVQQADWIRALPAGWSYARLKVTVASAKNGIWGDNPNGGPDDIICARVADFDRQRFLVTLADPTRRSVASSQRNGRILKPGDLLLEKSGGGEKQPVGAVVSYTHPEPAVCSNFVARIEVTDGHYSRFLTYVHASLYSQRVNTRSIKQTTGIQNLDATMYLNEVVALPPLPTQRAIADFLDRKTAAIDALIEKKERLIALLAEKRAALIHRAVTKGLNPDVPMKDSGVPWIGEIPARWEVRRIATFSSKITNGYVGPTRDLFVEEGQGIRYLQSLHIKDNSILFNKKYFVPYAWSASKPKSILRDGDVLVVQTGDIGQVAVVPPEFAGANCHALIIVSTRRHEVRGEFLSWVLNSPYGYHALKSIQTGALHPHLNCTFVREVPVPVPPVPEQDEITLYVDKLHAKTRANERLVHEQLAKLREYRQSLITAAVTGQLDIPGEDAA